MDVEPLNIDRVEEQLPQIHLWASFTFAGRLGEIDAESRLDDFAYGLARETKQHILIQYWGGWQNARSWHFHCLVCFERCAIDAQVVQERWISGTAEVRPYEYRIGGHRYAWKHGNAGRIVKCPRVYRRCRKHGCTVHRDINDEPKIWKAT